MRIEPERSCFVLKNTNVVFHIDLSVFWQRIAFGEIILITNRKMSQMVNTCMAKKSNHNINEVFKKKKP